MSAVAAPYSWLVPGIELLACGYIHPVFVIITLSFAVAFVLHVRITLLQSLQRIILKCSDASITRGDSFQSILLFTSPNHLTPIPAPFRVIKCLLFLSHSSILILQSFGLPTRASMLYNLSSVSIKVYFNSAPRSCIVYNSCV